MTKQKTTKKALLASVLSLMLCCVMLIGTTFAWFTDSVTSGNNKIVAGNLKIDLEVLDEEDNKTWTSVRNNPNPIFDYEYWEPGYTQVKILKVQNEGTLDLKWKAILTSNTQLSELADVIDVYVKEDVTEYSTERSSLEGWTNVGTLAGFVGTLSSTTVGELEAGKEETLGIAFKMQESAGNYYQGMDLGGAFDICITATQLTSEEDSFDEQYDKNAVFEVLDTEEELMNAAAVGGEYMLGADIAVNANVEVKKDMTLNLNGYQVVSNADGVSIFNVSGDADFTVYNGSVLVDPVATFAARSTSSAYHAIYFNSTGTLDVKDVYVKGSNTAGKRAVEVFQGTGSLTNVEIDTTYGTGVNAGSGANVTLNNCDIAVNGAHKAPYNSVCFSVMGKANVTVNGGNYAVYNVKGQPALSTHGGWLAIVMNSGGNITVNDGTFINVPASDFNARYERALFCAQATDTVTSTITLNGGKFYPQNNRVVELSGGATLDNEVTDVVGEDGLIIAGKGSSAVTADSIENVNTALANGGYVLLTADLPGNATSSSGYGKTAISQTNGGVIDGNGMTISANNATGTWDSAVYTKGGTIKNVSITKGFRGIFIADPTEDVIIDNVFIEGTTYTMHADDGGNVNLIVTNSTLNGWTSYTSNFASVSFTNCNFGYGNGYSYYRPYCATTLTDCDFEEGYTIDITRTSGIVFENCTYAGKPLTSENILEVVNSEAHLSNITIK